MNIDKAKLYCGFCNYQATTISNFNAHCQRNKHLTCIKMNTKYTPKIYICQYCRIKTSIKKIYENHLQTEKHKKNINQIFDSSPEMQTEIPDQQLEESYRLINFLKHKLPIRLFSSESDVNHFLLSMTNYNRILTEFPILLYNIRREHIHLIKKNLKSDISTLHKNQFQQILRQFKDDLNKLKLNGNQKYNNRSIKNLLTTLNELFFQSTILS